jgi:hypothetical protein
MSLFSSHSLGETRDELPEVAESAILYQIDLLMTISHCAPSGCKISDR